jgi:DNA-binding transcriptional ArsR family regulator
MKAEIQNQFSPEFLDAGTEVLRAIAHPIRLMIIDLLYHQKQLSVTEIYEALDIEQAIASHHLRILKDKGVVSAQRDGKKSFYYLCAEEYYTIVNLLQVLEV